jgi:hypothetical protein
LLFAVGLAIASVSKQAKDSSLTLWDWLADRKQLRSTAIPLGETP